MRIVNASLMVKTNLLVGMLGVMALLGSGYSSVNMLMVDQRYSDLLNGSVAAADYVGRANRAISDIVTSMYQNAAASSPEQIQEAAMLRTTSRSNFNKYIDAAAKALPAKEKELKAIRSSLDKLFLETCGSVMERLASSDRGQMAAAVGDMQKSCTPVIERTQATAVRFNDLLLKDVRVESKANNAYSWLSIGFAAGGTLLAVIVVMAVGIGFMSRTVSRPLRRLLGLMAEIEGGNYDLSIPLDRRKDEVGALAESLEGLRCALASGVAERAAQKEVDARQQAVIAERARLAERFVERTQEMVSGFGASSMALADSANNLTETASDTARQGQEGSSSADHASQNVHAVAASAEELTASIQEIASLVERSSLTASQAAEEARDSVSSVRVLSTAVHEIGEVVSMISDIASQTNLLALQCGHRGGKGGRSWTGFRDRCRRSQGVGEPDDGSNREDRWQDRRDQGGDRCRGAGDGRYRRNAVHDRTLVAVDCLRRRGAGLGNGRNRPQYPTCRRGGLGGDGDPGKSRRFLAADRYGGAACAHRLRRAETAVRSARRGSVRVCRRDPDGVTLS